MLTFVALLGLFAALLSQERHPLFRSFNDPIEREGMAAQWWRKEVKEALALLPLAIFLDVLMLVAIALLSS
ncbi:MAG: hypothetical protein AAB413_04075 [Patescibacteria group bacterium]